MKELVNFHVCVRLYVPAIHGCSFCNHNEKRVYPRTRILALIDASTLPIVQNYGRQRSVVTKNTKTVCFPKRKGRSFSKSGKRNLSVFSRIVKPRLWYKQKEKARFWLLPKLSLGNAWNVVLLAKLKMSNTTGTSASLWPVLLEKRKLFLKIL